MITTRDNAARICKQEVTGSIPVGSIGKQPANAAVSRPSRDLLGGEGQSRNKADPLLIETWLAELGETQVVRVVFAPGESYTRRLSIYSDRDVRDLRVASGQMAYAEHIDAAECVPPDAKAATRRVQISLAVETLFPALHHDSRLPA